MNKNQFPLLFAPLTIKKTTFRNRIFATPVLIGFMGPEQYPKLGTIDFFRARAAGGAASVCMGDVAVDKRFTMSGPPQSPTLDDRYMSATEWRSYAAAINETGAIASVELNHAGLATSPCADGYTIGPMDMVRPDGTRVRAMDDYWINETANKYADAAEFCKDVGMGMIMVHCGHGGLHSQFLSPLTNQRTDEYGGSAHNRARFTKLVLQRVRDRVGPDFIIEARVGVDEFAEGGATTEDSIVLFREIEDIVDIAHCSGGLHSVTRLVVRTHPTLFYPRGCNTHLAKAVKDAGIKIPVLTVGAIQNPAYGEELLQSGTADLVGYCRALIADPEMPNKARRGELDDIRPCTRCLNCHSGLDFDHYVECTVNPTVCKEWRMKDLTPARTPRDVAVIGGGPAGMQAAMTCADRGHKVTLFEKTGRLGGILNFTDHDAYKEDLRDFKDYLIKSVLNRAITVRYNTEATPELIAALDPYAVVVATGSTPVTPRIPGIDGKNVMKVLDHYNRLDEIGQRVVVIGGGQAGCEAGLHLRKLGHDVTVIEMMDKLAPDANYRHWTAVMDFLDTTGVGTHTNTTCTEITEKGVRAADKDGNALFFEADTVLYAVGMRPNPTMMDQLYPLATFVLPVGDCLKPAQVKQAIQAAYFAAAQLE